MSIIKTTTLNDGRRFDLVSDSFFHGSQLFSVECDGMYTLRLTQSSTVQAMRGFDKIVDEYKTALDVMKEITT